MSGCCCCYCEPSYLDHHRTKMVCPFFPPSFLHPPSPPSFDWFSVMNAQIGEALVVANLIMVILHSIFLSLFFFFFYTASFVFMLSSKRGRAPLIKFIFFFFTWSIKYCRSVVGSALGSSSISVAQMESFWFCLFSCWSSYLALWCFNGEENRANCCGWHTTLWPTLLFWSGRFYPAHHHMVVQSAFSGLDFWSAWSYNVFLTVTVVWNGISTRSGISCSVPNS